MPPVNDHDDLKTTDARESIHARVESRIAKVDYWKNGEQKQRWLATAFLDLERGYDVSGISGRDPYCARH